MFDFLSDNSIYVVLLIALIIWLGVFLYLFNLEKKLNKLESITLEKLEEKEK